MSYNSYVTALMNKLKDDNNYGTPVGVRKLRVVSVLTTSRNSLWNSLRKVRACYVLFVARLVTYELFGDLCVVDNN